MLRSLFACALALLFFPSSAQAVVILGTGTGALRHDGVTYFDLTDPDNNGAADNNYNYNARFFSSDEPNFGGGEFSMNIFDNRVGGGNDKWCCNPANPDGHQMTIKLNQARVIDSFTLTSSNDTPGRDPVDWSLSGSNDGINFTPIFSNSGSNLWTARNQVLLFEGGGVDYATPSAYEYVRFETTATGLTSGAAFALNEIELFDSSSAGEPTQQAVTGIAPQGSAGVFGIRELIGGGLINSTNEAESRLYNEFAGVPGQAGTSFTGTASSINFADPENAGGGYTIGTAKSAFLSDSAGAQDDFALAAHGYVEIPTDGTYTFGFDGDDGARFTLKGADFNLLGGGGQVFDETIMFEGNTGNAFTIADTFLEAGVYEAELIWYERGGGAFVELFAASGSTTNTGDFRLIGDVANGGLALVDAPVSAVPEPTAVALWALAGAGLLMFRRRKK